MGSETARENRKEPALAPRISCTVETAEANHIVCENYKRDVLETMHQALSPYDDTSKLLALGGLWPRATPRSLLALLSSISLQTLDQQWRSCLVSLCEAISYRQRGRRLLLAVEKDDASAFTDEIENEGHKGWGFEVWLEGYLLEIENNFMIRPIQARVAQEMMEPASSANSLLQLNMGKWYTFPTPYSHKANVRIAMGKSSVVIPLDAALIANGSRLSRIIVPKYQYRQNLDTLSQRLGGFMNRQIYVLPFSRQFNVSDDSLTAVEALLAECMTNCGILLAQPEHILSFKLMGIERHVFGDIVMGNRLFTIQTWLDNNVQDIIDESDEILDVNFQLIYTLGAHRMLDGQPDRWLLTQVVLDLIENHAWNLQKTHRGNVNVERRTSSSFPSIQSLSMASGKRLLSQVAQDVCEGRLTVLATEQFPRAVKDLLPRFFQDPNLFEDECGPIMESCAERSSVWRKLLLVRGLIAYNILRSVVQEKKWSIHYGLHPTRRLSAVPFRAKGVPSPSAEFGHPDVAVSLTCLSYYHDGLSDDQIRETITLLQRCDEPDSEYARWVERCDGLPQELEDWNALNVEDEKQCLDHVFPAFRYNKNTIDYYLSHVVFPKEGKEFSQKLSTSAWDIPSQPGSQHITTGFSGTNDNRFVLPLTIRQQDLPELQHTSAQAIYDVLREPNRRYLYAADEQNRQLSATDLFRHLLESDSKVRTLIDVGAQVLDIHNRELVQAWMEMDTTVEAGIFFNDEDQLMVLARDGKLERHATSSFQFRMDRCVVYLDEVHTRGTDLKLPLDTRAAVTLGPRLTKDRLVQGKSPRSFTVLC